MDFKQKFITSTAMALTLISGYGRRSYAACVSTGVPNYLCSGTETSGQYLGGVHNAYITTDSGFSVNTNSGDAISISGDGSLSFIDVNNSTIQTTSSQAGIRANLSGGNGPMLISTDGTISGGTFGIRASNYGTGSTSVIANGTVSATNGGHGIRASTTGIGGLSITTGSNSAVTGGWNGILARNDGRGALSIAIGGDVTGNLNNSNGIYALNSSISTDLTIQTLTGSTVTGANVGISARNYGSGSMEITAAGDVTGLTGYGIFARNRATTTNLIINTESTATIAGRYTGIFARNYGTGAITIHAGGNVSGTGAGGRYGIYANNRTTGTNLTIETDAGTTISGSRRGISARNQGSGALSITAGGDVTSTTDHAIYARNFGTDLLIETAAGTNIASGGNGIYAHNYGSGIADVSIDGLLQGGNYGLFLRNAGTDLSITTATGSIISGDSRGIYTVNTGIGSSSITVNGEVTGAIGVYVRTHSGTDLIVTTGSDSHVTGSADTGIFLKNNGSGQLSLSVNGEVTGNFYGVFAANYQGNALVLNTAAGSTISAQNGTGALLINQGTGGLNFINRGTVMGNTGIQITNLGTTSTGIVTDGMIEGTGGTAIFFQDGAQATATPIEIAGGSIIGDIVDNHYAYDNLSPVTVTGDFVSEGNFQVSDFNVASGGDFTLSAGNLINSYNTVDIDGTFTADGGNVSNSLSVNTGGVLNANEDFTIGGSFTNNGSTFIATGRNMVVDSMSAGTGDLSFGFNTVNDHALLTVTNGAADLTGQNILVNVTGVTGLATGEQALIISGASALIGGPGGTAVDVTDNSVLWNFRMVDGTGVGTPTSANDLFLIAGQAAPINNLTSTTNNEHVADVLMTLQSTTNPELALIVGNMNGASTTEAFNEILESTQSVVDNSERSVQTGFINYLQDMAGNRLDEIRSLSMPETSARFGMREDEQTAQVLPGLQVWGYGFGAAPEQGSDHGLNDLAGRQWLAGSAGYTKQSSRQGIDGFDAVSGGAVFGIDTGKTFSDRVFGLAFGYGHAEVDSKNANRAENEIDSLQLLAYASKTFQDNYYGELKASYAQSSNDTTRYNVGGVPGLTANGDFTSKQAGLQASVGKHILHNNYLITPEFGVNWLHYTSEGYTETGAGGANLTVDTKDADSIEIGGSVRIVKEIKRDSGAIILPEVRAGYYYDLSKDPIQKTVSFAGGGGSFLIETPNPSQHRINLGTGVTVKGTGSWDYSLNYNLNLEQQFQDHSLVARASWKF